MTRYVMSGHCLVLTGLLAVGCSRPAAPSGPPAGLQPPPGEALLPDPESKVAPEGVKYLLAAEPGGAKGVIDVRKEAQDGDEVVIVGRIGGSEDPFVRDRASFTLIDLSLEPCDDDGCGNPWCSVDRKMLKESTTLVKFVDGNGKTLPKDARQLLGVKMVQTVVIRGQVKRDEEGRVTVQAQGLHVKP